MRCRVSPRSHAAFEDAQWHPARGPYTAPQRSLPPGPRRHARAAQKRRFMSRPSGWPRSAKLVPFAAARDARVPHVVERDGNQTVVLTQTKVLSLGCSALASCAVDNRGVSAGEVGIVLAREGTTCGGILTLRLSAALLRSFSSRVGSPSSWAQSYRTTQLPWKRSVLQRAARHRRDENDRMFQLHRAAPHTLGSWN